MTVKDEMDLSRAELYALIYLTSSVNEGVVRVHPDIHGIYETWQAATTAQHSKSHPKDYYVVRGRWRKPE